MVIRSVDRPSFFAHDLFLVFLRVLAIRDSFYTSRKFIIRYADFLKVPPKITDGRSEYESPLIVNILVYFIRYAVNCLCTATNWPCGLFTEMHNSSS